MVMVSHSGKAGVWFSFSTGHLGFRGSLPVMLQEFKSNAASAQGEVYSVAGSTDSEDGHETEAEDHKVDAEEDFTRGEQPDVKQHLPRRGLGLEVNHQHHSKQEEEGEVRHDIPVKLDLRRAVQMDQPVPAAQRLQAPQAGEVTVGRKVTAGDCRLTGYENSSEEYFLSPSPPS
ncbi:hypothetical protein EYF80_035816 [Liparis tanakae]|uniref:Uncharacterized protein n=1 Tax=Liparis tanakae TaxID=230148 RepID=A0A4Z2GMW1_9TELE|nr:hypothetical protein EYF80_035816 [Liparis tanakae]